MSYDIPAEFPTFARAEYLVTKGIDAEDWKKILDAHHREFAESGSRVPGMWPYPDASEPSFQTTSGTLTQTNDAGANWDLWHPCFSLYRDLQSGSTELLLLSFCAVVELCEVKYTVVAEDLDGTTTSLGTATLTPAGSGHEVLTDTLTITAANADEGAVADEDPRTITVYAQGRSTSSPSTGTVFADHIEEFRLLTTSTAIIPRGY